MMLKDVILEAMQQNHHISFLGPNCRMSAKDVTIVFRLCSRQLRPKSKTDLRVNTIKEQ